jgi:signal transduction histidine kinase
MPPSDAPKAKVLLVDDQPANLLALRTILEGFGYDLVDALSGAEALRQVLQDAFAAILLDVRMPGLGGIEVARLIRSRKRSRDTPIIFLTAYEAERDTVEEAYVLGAVDFLVKPLHPAALRAKVAQFVELFDKVQQVQRQAEQLRAAERREFERRLAEEALREVDRRKDEFLATLAHELRNPLAPIRNAVGLMRLRGPGDPDLRWAVDVVERQSQQLTRLVDDLLDISRIRRGKVRLTKEVVDLAAVVRSAVEAARPLLDERRHQLVVDLGDGPLPLEADPTRLAQVLANLLNNSAKYTEPGGHIRLTARREGGAVVIRVRDTGIGIGPELLPRVFDLFVQAEEARGRANGGLGIGLSLVRRLVELHGGTVEARSDGPGRGSEFAVRLPAPFPQERQGDGPVVVSGRPPSAAPRRILVVDDNVDAADSLARLLGLQGHEVRVAHDGLAGLEAARASPPELVFLDLGLPGVDGYEVARRIRRQPQTQGTVLVALTGWGQEDARRRSREAGFDHHLVKPVDLEALRALLACPRLVAQGAS